MRIALGIEYDGSPYKGWQVQHRTRTVQGCVEAALARVADHELRVHCAGRTDTGVHACGQVVHFDTTAQRSMYGWERGSNANLPDSISVIWARQVSDDFHARFSARRRSYRYIIFNRPMRPAIHARHVVWDYRPLDEIRMASAAAFLLGEHDFSSYRALACQAKSPVRTLYRLDVTRRGEFIFLDLEANGFLHHMVRNIAGVLMAIGSGEQPPEWAQQVLKQRDRTLGGVTAAPQGLYLVRVDYPEEFALPRVSQVPGVW